ncbi:NPCC-domain-containing protein [Hypoxylon trugodes]|uniref:NPCC-domain-containing protein n=1 Tax=Hypoxylon trugodes TaxID=326681 RepID=UPI0021901083|nr:NPCC-domain-containing protein [Hypoxylon trugodes]KAI1391435.1 NPCC-domain-containing protein [Hypoxylon trugodes]
MSSTKSQTAVTTPKKSTPATPPVTDSPGTWHHPRLHEITRRQEATNFTEKNIKRIAVNVLVLIACVAVHTLLARWLPPRKTFPYSVWWYTRWIYRAILTIPLFNIGTNLLPLVRPKDDLSDIPLTPGQRRLLGLPSCNAPPTPGSVYSTPPRYARTPSISGSAGSKRSFSSSPRSPASNYGSPNGNGGSGGFSGLASPGSPLLQKAMNGARRSSLGSLGSPSPMGQSTGSFFGVPDSPTPNPSAGKRSTVGLNSKWLYERGRDRRSSSGNAWLYT